jgi:transposase
LSVNKQWQFLRAKYGRWQISDELWEKMALLIPEHKTSHPLSTQRKRVVNRGAMNGQWKELNGTHIGSRRFQKWRDAGILIGSGRLVCGQLDAICDFTENY